MHERELSLAILPKRYGVYGLPMLPYSVGHEIILYRENNPLVTGEGIVSCRDVAEAAFVCCQTFEENQTANPLMTWLKIKLWQLRTRKMNPDTEALKFATYRAESLALPKHHAGELPKGSTVRMTGTPMIFQLLRFVMAMGISERDAMNYPLGLARWHWLASEEKLGNVYVESEYDAHIARLQKGDFKCPA